MKFSTIRNVELIYNIDGDGRSGIRKDQLAALIGDMDVKEIPGHAEVLVDSKNRQVKVTWLENISPHEEG